MGYICGTTSIRTFAFIFIFKEFTKDILAILFVFSVLLLQRLSAHVLLLASCSNSLGDMLALSGMLRVSGLFFDILAFLEKCFDL